MQYIIAFSLLLFFYEFIRADNFFGVIHNKNQLLKCQCMTKNCVEDDAQKGLKYLNQTDVVSTMVLCSSSTFSDKGVCICYNEKYAGNNAIFPVGVSDDDRRKIEFIVEKFAYVMNDWPSIDDDHSSKMVQKRALYPNNQNETKKNMAKTIMKIVLGSLGPVMVFG